MGALPPGCLGWLWRRWDRHLGGRTSLHPKSTPSRPPPLSSSPAPLSSLGLVDMDTSGPSRSLCRVKVPEGLVDPPLDHRPFKWESRE